MTNIDILHYINPIIDSVRKTLLENQFASGGLALGIIGGTVAMLRQLPKQLIDWAYERVVISIEVNSSDQAYEWFAVWLGKQPVQLKMRDLNLKTRRASEEGGFSLGEEADAPKALLAPTNGKFWIRFQGRPFWLSANREKMQGQNGLLASFHETLTVRTFVWNRAFVNDLIAEAYRSTVKPEEKRVEIMTPRWDDWNVRQRVIPRAPESLVYSDNLLENIVADAKKFLESEAWYADMGIPWRRGYLLHGPPGNGKSSLITAVAGVLGKSICVLNLSSLSLTDDSLTNLLGDAPDGSLILLEDVDAVFNQRNKASGNESKLSFNGLLNALDGVTAQQGRLVFLTTNHLEKLDPALVRPGRADAHFFLNNASQMQVQKMLTRFYPSITSEQAASLAARVPEHALSMAKIQEFMLRHRDDLAGAMADWKELEEARVSVQA
jgi:mitochondrial chaperone BCS1